MNKVNNEWIARENCIWIQFLNIISTKALIGIKLQKKNLILLQKSPYPFLWYSFNTNTSSWEENISINYICEEILTIPIVIMDYNMCKIEIVYV
jgi:hypothetical protein